MNRSTDQPVNQAMILGGYIVTRADGGPLYGYGRTIHVHDSAAEAAASAKASDKGVTHKNLGPLSVAAVELKILPQRKQR